MITLFERNKTSLLLALSLTFTISTFSREPLAMTLTTNPQRTIYYDQYLHEALDFIPEKNWGFAINFSVSPNLKDNVYVNLGFVNSFQKQYGYSDYMNAQIDRKFNYFKLHSLLSIRTKNWDKTKVSANFEFGPQLSALMNEELSVTPADNPYASRNFNNEFKNFTFDLVGQVTVLFKLSHFAFLTTGIRYDKTISSPNQELIPYWRSSLDGQKMEYYHKTIGIVLGLTIAI